jgi:hypothetical protein
MTRNAHDTLFIWDDRLLRVSTFDGSGEFLKSRQVLGHDADDLPTSVRGRFADGSLLLVPGPIVWIDGEQGIRRSPVAYQRYDPVTDQITELATGWSMETVVEKGIAYILPFSRREIVIADGDALIVADNGIARLRYYNLAGELLRIVEWESELVPVRDVDRRWYLQRRSEGLPASGDPADVRFPRYHPRLAAILPDNRGRAWVLEYAPPGEPPPGWLVFDTRGRLRCRVTMPMRLGVWEIGSNYMIGVRIDSLGGESIVSHPVNERAP